MGAFRSMPPAAEERPAPIAPCPCSST